MIYHFWVLCTAIEPTLKAQKGGRHRYMKYLLFIATGFMGNWGRQYINVLESKARAIASSQGHQVCSFPQAYRHVTHTHIDSGHIDLFTLDLFLLLTNTWAVSGFKHIEACSHHINVHVHTPHKVSTESPSNLLSLAIIVHFLSKMFSSN